jgi:hypothetical protein
MSMLLPDYVADGQEVSALAWNQLIDYLRSVTVVPSGHVLPDRAPGGTRLRLRAAGQGNVRMQDLAFGHVLLSGAGVRILGGYFAVLGRCGCIITEADITVTGGNVGAPHWIYVQARRSDPFMVEIVYGAAAPDPSNATYFQIPLRRVYKANGRAVVLQPYYCVGSPIVVGGAL